MEIIITTAYTSFFIFLIQKLRFFEIAGLSKNTISFLLIIKVCAGIALWAVYTFYYTDRATADIYKYFDDSKLMYDALFTAPSDYFKMLFGIGNSTPHFSQYYSQMNNWYREYESALINDNHTIIRFNALVRLFSFGYYNVHTVFMSFISLIGMVALYKFFYEHVKLYRKLLILVLFLLPSVLFWSSGVMKEGLIFLSLGFLLLSAKRLVQGYRHVYYFSAFAFGLFLLYHTKFYVLLTIAPALLAWSLCLRSGIRQTVIRYALVYGTFLTIALNMYHIFPDYHVIDILRYKQKDFMCLANGGVYLKSDSATIYIPVGKKNIVIPAFKANYYKIKTGEEFYYFKTALFDDTLKTISADTSAQYKFISNTPETKSRIRIKRITTPASLIYNTPEALVNTLLRPYVWESRSPLMVLPALENIFVLVLIILLVMSIRPIKQINFNLMLFCLLYAFSLHLVVGITTPVLGAIARYKIPAMGFLLIGFMIASNTNKLFLKIPLLKRIFGE